MPDTHEYAFDVTVMAALRVHAADEQQARDKLAKLLDCASTNFGELDGQPVVAEASQYGRASLYEVDGEPYEDQPSLVDACMAELRNCVAAIDKFDKRCARTEYTDTDIVWEMFNGMRERMKTILHQASKEKQ